MTTDTRFPIRIEQRTLASDDEHRIDELSACPIYLTMHTPSDPERSRFVMADLHHVTEIKLDERAQERADGSSFFITEIKGYAADGESIVLTLYSDEPVEIKR